MILVCSFFQEVSEITLSNKKQIIFIFHRHRSSSASTPGHPGNATSGSTQIASSTFTTYVEETPKLCGYLLKQSEFSSAASIAASKAASAAATIG